MRQSPGETIVSTFQDSCQPKAGAVRSRPIFLTAATTLLGAWPITLDPIFSGLAWSLIFGLVVSTIFTLVIIPTIFFLIYEGRCGIIATEPE